MSRGFSLSRGGFGAAERAAPQGMFAKEAEAALKELGVKEMGGLTQDSYTAFEPANAGPEFKNERSNPASLINAELNLRENTTHEVGAFFDGNTGKPIIVHTDYQPDAVFFTMDKIRALRAVPGGVVFTHNHPRSTAFSSDDFVLMLGANCRELRITSGRFGYSLSDKTGKFREEGISPKTLRLKKGFTKNDFEKMRSEIRSNMTDGEARAIIQEATEMSLKNGTSGEVEEELARTNFEVAKMAAKLGLEYRRTPLYTSKK